MYGVSDDFSGRVVFDKYSILNFKDIVCISRSIRIWWITMDETLVLSNPYLSVPPFC